MEDNIHDQYNGLSKLRNNNFFDDLERSLLEDLENSNHQKSLL